MATKVIWITGASSGIGAACAKKYNAAGWNVILSSRNKRELEKVKESCTHSDKCEVLVLDLCNSEEFAEKVSYAIQIYGHIDSILHSGGISQRSLLKNTSLDVDRKLMEVNFFGTIALTKAILPHFIEKQSGSFGVVSSLVGKFGTPYRSSYAASKHALHGFFDTLRAELYRNNIYVTMICPGFIKTKVSINALTGDGKPLNEMDDAQANGMEVEKCAEKIFVAMSKKKREVNIGGKEVLGVYAKRFVPGIFARIIQTAKVR